MPRRPADEIAAAHALPAAARPTFFADARWIDLVIALGLGAGPLALFLATLCPTIYVEDAAELATAAGTFGVPHPPGYALYTVLAGVFVRIVRIGDVGFRANLFSALGGAATAMLAWRFLRRLSVGRAAALASVLALVTGTAFWSASAAAEVHTLDTVLLLGALMATETALRTNARATWATAGGLAGLAIGHRNLNALLLAGAALALGLKALRSGTRAEVTKRAALYLGAALLAWVASELALALLASRDPWLNMGEPSTLANLWGVLTAKAYLRHLASSSLSTDLGRAAHFVHKLPANLGWALLAVPVSLTTFTRQPADRRALLLPIAWLVAACFVFAACYNVLDVASYFIPAYLGLTLIAALGFESWSSRWRWLLPVAALALLPWRVRQVDLSHTTVARDYARDLWSAAPPGALVLSLGDTETHVMGYDQAVEGQHTDAILVSGNEIDAWYVAQLRRRHPQIVWPGGERGLTWLTALVAANADAHPVCLTQPLDFLLPREGWSLLPRGLLYCLARKATPATTAVDLAPALAFWKTARAPSGADRAHPDVHVKMIVFAYALARFTLAAKLVQAGEETAARAELAALVQSHPDDTEAAIAEALRTIGKELAAPLALEERARRALALPTGAPALAPLLEL